MKAQVAFQNLKRALQKSGKLDEAVSHKLNSTIAQMRHSLHTGDRQNANRHFEKLCDLLRDVLER